MDGQLGAIVDDLESAAARLHALCAAVPAAAWASRPARSRWSPAECVAHLNLTSAAVLPLLHDGLRSARAGRIRASRRYRCDPVGWLIGKLISPSCRVRTVAIPDLVPAEPPPVETLVADFDRLQADLVACVRGAEGLPIDAVTLTSPFTTHVRYNLYAALTLVPRHQHRHLDQAVRAAQACAPAIASLAQ